MSVWCQSVFDSSVSWLSPVGREVAVRNSPSKLVPQLKLSSTSCHITVAVAENDSPEFRKQSEEYYKVSAANITKSVLQIEHEHYFDYSIKGIIYKRGPGELFCKKSSLLY